MEQDSLDNGHSPRSSPELCHAVQRTLDKLPWRIAKTAATQKHPQTVLAGVPATGLAARWYHPGPRSALKVASEDPEKIADHHP